MRLCAALPWSVSLFAVSEAGFMMDGNVVGTLFITAHKRLSRLVLRASIYSHLSHSPRASGDGPRRIGPGRLAPTRRSPRPRFCSKTNELRSKSSYETTTRPQISH